VRLCASKRMREEHASGTHHALGSQKLQARHQAHARRTACAAHRLPGPGEADPKGSKQGGGSRTPSVPRLQNSSSSHSSSRDTALIGPAGPPRQQEGPSPSTARSPALAGVVACASRRTMFGCASSAVSAASTGWPARMSSARPENSAAPLSRSLWHCRRHLPLYASFRHQGHVKRGSPAGARAPATCSQQGASR